MTLPPFQFLLKSIRFVRQNVNPVLVVVVFALAISGCTDSDDQTPKDTDEPVPAAQESPASKQVSPAVEEEEKDVAVTEPEPSSIREDAQKQLTRAQEAVGKAEKLLQRAPSGKGSDFALSNLQQEIESAQALLQTGQEQFQDQQFQKARTQAQEATDKADAVAQHIEQAINTVTRQSP